MICRCVIDKSWLMQESRGLKPNWLDEIKSLSRKKANISLHKSLSKFYRKLEVKSLGDNFLRFVCHLFCELAQHQLFSTRMDIYPCVCNGIWIWSMTKKKKKMNMLYGKKQKPGNAGNQQKAFQIKIHSLLTVTITRKLLKSYQIVLKVPFWF